VQGFQKLRPGASVAPEEWKPVADPATTSSSESKASAG
jgi:hypothetical protein